jgi:hypothetical protein
MAWTREQSAQLSWTTVQYASKLGIWSPDVCSSELVQNSLGSVLLNEAAGLCLHGAFAPSTAAICAMA